MEGSIGVGQVSNSLDPYQKQDLDLWIAKIIVPYLVGNAQLTLHLE